MAPAPQCSAILLSDSIAKYVRYILGLYVQAFRGATLKSLTQEVFDNPGEWAHYRVVVLHIGTNDVNNLTLHENPPYIILPGIMDGICWSSTLFNGGGYHIHYSLIRTLYLSIFTFRFPQHLNQPPFTL